MLLQLLRQRWAERYTFVVVGRGEIGGGRMGGGGGWTGIKHDTTFLVVAGAGGGASGNASQCPGSATGGNGGGTADAQNGANGICAGGGPGGAAVADPTVGAGGGGYIVEPGQPGTMLGGGVGGFDIQSAVPAGDGGGSYGLAGAASSFQSNGNLQLSTGGAGGFGGGGSGSGHNMSTSTPVAVRSGGGGGGGYAGGAGGDNDYGCSVCGAGGGGGSSFVMPDGENTTHTQGGGSDPDDDGRLFITHAAPPQPCVATARTPVTVTVNTATVSMQPQNVSVCNTPTASFSVSVTGGTVTYQWQQKIGAASFTNIADGGNFSGATTATLSLSALTSTFNGRQYRCVLTPTGGCAAFNSNAATLTFNTVTAGTVLASQTICPGGDPAAFTQASGPSGTGTLTFRWEKSTTNCSTGFSPIPGAGGFTYNEPAGLAQTTYFRRVATYTQSGQVCEATSNCLAVATVDNTPPSITCPANQTVTATGGSYTLADFTPSATATDNCPLAPTKTQSPVAGTSLSVGNQTVTITATDGGGNTATCSFSLNVVAGCPATGSVWFVDAAAASGGTGSSWACAFQNLQDAINAATSGQEIWVKTGTYKPTKDPSGNASPLDPRDKVFYLKNGVALYGGFAGTETARSQRNWVSNATILSGDLGAAGNRSDNAYHVLLSVGDGSATVVDGFKIQNGNGNGAGNITVEGQTIARNEGGGMRNVASAPALSNCVFSANEAVKGGGIFNSDGGL